MPSLAHYQNLSDGFLLEAAKYERPSPELVKALAERLDDYIVQLSNAEFRIWSLKEQCGDSDSY